MIQGVGSNGNFDWNNMEDNGSFNGDGFSEVSRNSKFLKSEYGGSAEYEDNINISEAANKRLKQSPMDSNEKAQLVQTLLSLRPLGLTLGKTPSYLDLTEVILPEKNKSKRAAETNPNAFQMMTEKEKLKASNFGATLLRIGSWQRLSQNEGDLVAKCYYAKRKLVWEILDTGLKSKIEIQWSDILAIRAVIKENEAGILEIELQQPPTFHRESNPQPRKHTMWNVASDFTNGQALTHRRHYLQFPPGVLDKHYEKLIQCETRFLELSQRPFPSQRSPYFYSEFNNGNITEFSFNFDGHGTEIPSNLPFPSCIQTQLDPTQQILTYEQTQKPLMIKDSTSPISVMEFSSPLDEVIGNQGVENPHMPYWDQGITSTMTSFEDFLGREQLPGLISVAAAAQVNPTISFRNFDAYNDGLGHANLESEMLRNIEKQLLIDSQVDFSYKQIIPQVNSLVGLPEQVNSAVTTGTNHTDYGQMTGNGNLVSDETIDVLQPHPMNWVMPPPRLVSGWVVPPQGTPRNSETHMAENNSTYPSFSQNPTMEEFANFNNLANRWH